MKKLISIINLVILLFFVFIIYLDNSRTITIDECEPVSVYVEFSDYSYDELKNKSDLIVLAEICDELNSKNSVLSYGDKIHANVAYAVRHAKILKVYKNNTDRHLNEYILVKDFNAVSHDKFYYQGFNDEALVKNNRYVLFLNEENMTEKSTKAAKEFLQRGEDVDLTRMYSIFCTRKGKINMTDDSMNIQSLKYSFLLDYETPASKKNLVTERILQINAKKELTEPGEYDRYYSALSVDTNYGDLTIKQAYTGNSDKLYFEVSSEDGDKYAIFSNFTN